MRKPLNSSVPEELITKIDEFVVNSKGDFKGRSHLVEQAIRLYIGDEISMRSTQNRKINGQTTSPTSSLYETSLFPRFLLNTEEKHAIAEQAANLIESNKALFIDGSTTCIELAKVLALQNRRLTIVTNSVLICLELGHSSNIRIIGVGGEFDPASASYVGRTSEEAVEKFYVDYAIFSTKGFIPLEGTFESSMGTLRTKQVVTQRCNQVILLVDHSKFGQRSLCKVLDSSQIHTIVTDSEAPKEAVDQLRLNGHEVHIVEIKK